MIKPRNQSPLISPNCGWELHGALDYREEIFGGCANKTTASRIARDIGSRGARARARSYLSVAIGSLSLLYSPFSYSVYIRIGRSSLSLSRSPSRSRTRFLHPKSRRALADALAELPRNQAANAVDNSADDRFWHGAQRGRIRDRRVICGENFSDRSKTSLSRGGHERLSRLLLTSGFGAARIRNSIPDVSRAFRYDASSGKNNLGVSD